VLTERISREIAHVPAFNESISTLDGKPHGHVLYSWNSGYWWLRHEIGKRLGQAGPDPVEAAIDERLGVVRAVGMLRLEPEAPATVADQPNKEVAFHRNWAAAEPLPFFFIYGGRPSGEWIGRRQRTVEEKAIDATKVQRIITLNDPDTGLQVRAVLAIYTDTPGVAWTLYFANQGTNDTPLLEQLHAAVRDACRPRCVQNCA
jgi:hypothetical protein